MSVPIPPFDDNSEINDEQWKIWFSQLCDTLKTDSGWMNPAGTTSVPGGNPSFSADKNDFDPSTVTLVNLAKFVRQIALLLQSRGIIIK